MVRKLKFHEQKLLKKVDFISWTADKKEVNNREVIRKYHILKRDDFNKYSLLVKEVQQMAALISRVGMNKPFAQEMAALLRAKLHSMGLIRWHIKFLSEEHFCRRRLPAMMVQKNMVRTITEATRLVQQGHVRVGPEIIKDPAYLVTRHMEDFITWVDTSAIKRHVMEYNEMRDDYEMM